MHNHEFFGSTIIGERGQLVVPREARTKLKLEKGEKVLVFGVGNKGIFITKLSSFKKLSAELKKRNEEIENIIKSN
ncbi:AbrB/MazE/SpoVT family DNA-binding domain-containing protein [bacterium]|nr:AbrB/MazE/SpoVT family DNA-binding domain-containing protein [bacterium]